MIQASAGCTVSIHYTGTLADGSVFDRSTGREPLTFRMGAGQIIPGLEAALDGMGVGETKIVTIPADQAYGPYHEQAIKTVPRDMIPDGIPLDLGSALQLQAPNGSLIPVTVTALSDVTVTLDANHPLAGKDLTFAVEIMAIA